MQQYENNRKDEIKQYWFAVKELTNREIKRKYARSNLGIIWSVLNPLLNMVIMSLIFSYMFRHSIDNFPVYYLIGQTVFSFFNVASNNTMTTIVDNKSLIMRTKLPKEAFILSRIYTALVNFGYTLIPLIGILIFFRIKPTWTMLLFVADFLLLFFITLGISFVLSVVYVFFADITYLYGIFITILMYMSALFYPISALPEGMQRVISFNPMYMTVNIARHVVMYGDTANMREWLLLIIYALSSMIFGVTVFKKYENAMMQKI